MSDNGDFMTVLECRLAVTAEHIVSTANWNKLKKKIKKRRKSKDKVMIKGEGPYYYDEQTETITKLVCLY